MAELSNNQKNLLKIIKRRQPISKYELWSVSNLNSYATVWNELRDLISKKVLKEEPFVNEKNRNEMRVSLL